MIFKFKGTDVHCRELTTGCLDKKSQRTCFCCEKKINNCESVLLVNNYQLIPNMLLHKKCFDECKGKEDELFQDIEQFYNEWKALNMFF